MAALVSFMAPTVAGNLIGLDFGSTYMKATLVKPGQPFAIVENTASKRKTEAMLSLAAENRLFGADSMLEMSKYPQTTFDELPHLFGQKFDLDEITKFKEKRFVYNEIVSDERGFVAWKFTREAYGNEERREQTLFSEETVAMLIEYVKMLAEKQAGGQVRDCVITIPSWFTYDQRLMVKDAAQLANMHVLQLTHENTAAAVMFGIDRKFEQDKSLTVLFYNMGGMDTEVSIARFTMQNVTEKKSSPYIEVLSETYDQYLGGRDLDNTLVRILAEKFDALPERQGKESVLNKVKAVKRLKKEAIKIKEVLSANKQATIKIPELFEYVTLQTVITREEFEAAAPDFFSRVAEPITKALDQAGLKIEDIDQVELLGGGIRVPKVNEILETTFKGKDLGFHLNGDEAMCFGSAFIASNSSSQFKVKHVFLTQHPHYDVKVRISALNDSDALTEEEQRAEGVEEDDLIKYNQEFKLFNTTDYFGKTKALSMNYNKNMKVELFKVEGDSEPELLDTYHLTDLEDKLANEIASIKREEERAKKKAEKAKNATNSTEGEEKPKEEPVEETAAKAPKIKVSIELSRSGWVAVSKATVGSRMIDVEHQRKLVQMTSDQLRQAKSRLKWYDQRDKDKAKTDMAKNEFESMVYSLRSWLRDDDNEAYVEPIQREEMIERLNEHEDWLYEDGANANYTVYEQMHKNLSHYFD